jgi:hypothetical protein
MTMPNSTGYLDPDSGYVLPADSGTWTTAATWNAFTSWAMSPSTLVWAVEPVDLGSVKTFNLKIQTEAVGLVSYNIYTSTTGAFAGEETITSIAQGATGVAAFTGRFVWIEVTVTRTAGVNVLYSIDFSITEQANKFSLNDVDTSTLSGTSAARTLTLPKTVSSVTNIQITPKTVANYTLLTYVTDYPTCNTVLPRVLSKTTPYQIALVGLDNVPRDAIVDLLVEYLPEGYMSGNNLLVR